MSLIQAYSSVHVEEKYLSLGQPEKEELKLSPAAYCHFLGLAHRGGGWVLLLLLAIPPVILFYMGFLVGQSTDKTIFKTYLILASVYLFLVMFRGLVLTEYMRVASKKLFQRVIHKYTALKGNEALALYKGKDQTVETYF